MRVGFDKAVFSFLLTHKAVYRREKHEAERYLDLLRILGIADDGRGLDMFLTEHSKERAESLFKKWKVSSGKAVGLIIGSQWKTKRWPASHFARLVDLLYDEMGAVCIIFGTDADRETANKVYTLSKNKPIIACGETRVSDLPALFTKCYLLIGGDTGSMHIGVAVDAKCVVIFGPTTPELGFGPYRGDAVVVEKKGLSCRPCSLHGSDKCKEKHFFCMEKITPEEVLSAALSLQLAS
jgi:heptosyltransferase-2